MDVSNNSTVSIDLGNANVIKIQPDGTPLIRKKAKRTKAVTATHPRLTTRSKNERKIRRAKKTQRRATFRG